MNGSCVAEANQQSHSSHDQRPDAVGDKVPGLLQAGEEVVPGSDHLCLGDLTPTPRCYHSLPLNVAMWPRHPGQEQADW